jgi:hypothetical protein
MTREGRCFGFAEGGFYAEGRGEDARRLTDRARMARAITGAGLAERNITASPWLFVLRRKVIGMTYTTLPPSPANRGARIGGGSLPLRPFTRAPFPAPALLCYSLIVKVDTLTNSSVTYKYYYNDGENFCIEYGERFVSSLCGFILDGDWAGRGSGHGKEYQLGEV